MPPVFCFPVSFEQMSCRFFFIALQTDAGISPRNIIFLTLRILGLFHASSKVVKFAMPSSFLKTQLLRRLSFIGIGSCTGHGGCATMRILPSGLLLRCIQGSTQNVSGGDFLSAIIYVLIFRCGLSTTWNCLLHFIAQTFNLPLPQPLIGDQLSSIISKIPVGKTPSRPTFKALIASLPPEIYKLPNLFYLRIFMPPFVHSTCCPTTGGTNPSALKYILRVGLPYN